MNKTVLLGAIGAAVTVAALAINYAVTWQDAAVEPVAIEPVAIEPVATGPVATGPAATELSDAAPVVDAGASTPAAVSEPSGSAPAPAAEEAERPSTGETATASLETGAAPKAPAASGTGAVPSVPEFDIVRINPSGDAVIGGRAAPGSLVTLYRDGRAVESITADDRGEWVMLPGVGVLNGAREISLSAQLPGQPELRSEQVVMLVMPDPSLGGSQTPLAMLVPREGDRTGAQPAPTGAAEPAVVDTVPTPPPAETVAAPEPPAAEPVVETAPVEAATSIGTAEAPAEPATAPVEAVVAPKPGPLPVENESQARQAASTDAGVATGDGAELLVAAGDAAAETPAAAPATTEAAAAESAAAAVLELPSLAELEAIGATGGASDTAVLDEPEPEDEPAPEEALGGVVAEGRAAEALAAVEPPPALEAPPAVEPPPVVETAALVEGPPAAVEAPQRTTGAGVDSASSQPLVATTTVLAQPPARVTVDDNSQRTLAGPPPAAEPPAGARNVPDAGLETVAALDIGVSRDAGPGGDSAAAVPDGNAADAERPDVAENITVTEIMIELKWSRPVVTANPTAGEIVAADLLTIVPETPSPFRVAALPVLTDAPSGALWTETLPRLPDYPGVPIAVALTSPPTALEMVAVRFTVPPALEPSLPALPAPPPQRAVAAPDQGLLVVEAAPTMVRFAALEAAVLPAAWTLREPALPAPLPRAFDAAIPAPGDAGGRGPLAPVIAAPAGLDLLDTASYQSTNPAAEDMAAAPSTVSPLDAATYQSATPTVGGGIAAGTATEAAAPTDSVDALMAEAQSALDAATRAEQALDGSAVAEAAPAGPAVLPDGSSPASTLPSIAVAEHRPGEAGEFAAITRPAAMAAEIVAPADWGAPETSIEVAAAETDMPAAVESVAVEPEASTEAASEAPAATSELAAAVEAAAAADPLPATAEVEIALATPETAEAELQITEPGLDLGSFQRDERLTIGGSVYEDLDSETLRGEGIRSGTVALQSVEYDERGEVIIGGTATPNAPVNIYVDNVHVGSAVAGAAGEWSVMPNQPLSEGLHYLRVDQVEEGGRVVARVESPFARVEPIAVTAGGARVVVQPGNSLWRIARRTLADGTRFTAIYEANKSQITDPNMIYPGQVFVVPVSETSNN